MLFVPNVQKYILISKVTFTIEIYLWNNNQRIFSFEERNTRNVHDKSEFSDAYFFPPLSRYLSGQTEREREKDEKEKRRLGRCSLCEIRQSVVMDHPFQNPWSILIFISCLRRIR